jgi:hypothetical protein
MILKPKDGITLVPRHSEFDWLSGAGMEFRLLGPGMAVDRFGTS